MSRLNVTELSKKPGFKTGRVFADELVNTASLLVKALYLESI